MWAYSYETDKRTKEKTRKIIWVEDKLPSIETEIKDSPVSLTTTLITITPITYTALPETKKAKRGKRNNETR